MNDSQPYDDQHSTPPNVQGTTFRAGQWGDHVEPGEASYDYLRNRLTVFDSPENRAHVAAVLDELDRLRNDAEDPSAPRTGLNYVDPVGRFVCRPADPSWLQYARGSDWFSTLELRVMQAYLLTALDNTRAALLEKGSVTQ